MKKKINVINDCMGMYDQDIIDAIFESRGIKDVKNFLNPGVEYILPLDSLYRVDEAGRAIVDGITNGKKFFVNIDSDNDGVFSGSIVVRYLRGMGCNVDWHVSEGKTHGTSYALIDKLKVNKPDILIIVDSLDSTIDNYKLIHDMGIEIIIIDHHDIGDLPYDDYTILVSSNRKYGNKELSGSGVAWKTMKYIDYLLGTMDADNLVDFAGGGLVADMVDMSEASMENRAIVNLALNNLCNPAMKKIIGNYEFNSSSYSFSIAPLINSSCRYNENEAAVRTFLSDDNKEILKNLRVLKKCKEQQSADVSELLPELIEQADNQAKDHKVIIVVIDANPGISGLLGNQLLQRYQRPIMVLKENYSGYSGSCRSIGCGNFRQLCEDTGLIETGGHPEAFGVINLDYNNFDTFRERIEEALSDIEFETTYDIDVELDVSDINEQLINNIKKIDKISGTGFKPVSVMVELDDFEATTMSQGKHLVCNVGNFGKFKAIKWNAGSLLEEFEDYELCSDMVRVWGNLDCGFLGRSYSLRLIIDDYEVD